ncbi:MAG TPA: metallophosphoesterase [Anaerohalosphaeraceae bacterium]|nr:metallophosphoesterase [Anaerohalosphaeraceae bacterium]
MEPIKILLLADLHGRADGLESIAGGWDAVVLAGDITNYSEADKAKKILDILEKKCPYIFGVPGNCDSPRVKEILEERGFLLNGSIQEVKGLKFLGVGGTEPAVLNHPKVIANSNFLKLFEQGKPALKAANSIVLVTHQPPFETAVDKFTEGKHTGSLALRRFIEEAQPILAVSGHMHQARGIDKIGKTHLVNPGPFLDGFYAIAHLAGNSIKIDLLSI